MEIEQSEVMILTPDGRMPAFVYTSTKPDYKPAVLLLMEAFGLTRNFQHTNELKDTQSFISR
jgi:carboxymethylenebutenolidase